SSGPYRRCMRSGLRETSRRSAKTNVPEGASVGLWARTGPSTEDRIFGSFLRDDFGPLWARTGPSTEDRNAGKTLIVQIRRERPKSAFVPHSPGCPTAFGDPRERSTRSGVPTLHRQRRRRI